MPNLIDTRNAIDYARAAELDGYRLNYCALLASAKKINGFLDVRLLDLLETDDGERFLWLVVDKTGNRQTTFRRYNIVIVKTGSCARASALLAPFFKIDGSGCLKVEMVSTLLAMLKLIAPDSDHILL
jgi:hypothetical protein